MKPNSKPTLTHLYETRRAAGELLADEGQAEALAALAALAARLPKIMRTPLWPLQRRPKNRGLYIYGPVGRGKTMLMDLFYSHVDVPHKKRVHFHAFMLDVHRRLHVVRAKKEERAIEHVARDLAREAKLLCFDEFQVYNIADAMILSRLFRALFRAGVAVVATSNVAPDDLYKDGLQRALFLPFIDVIKKRLAILAVGTGQDYRQKRLKGKPVYFSPADVFAAAGLQRIFDELTDKAEPVPLTIEVDGRKILAPRTGHGVAWFTFDELCRQPLGAADYLALASRFHTLIVQDVPPFSDARRDEALRFIHLVDCLYDTQTKIAISAAAMPDKLMDKHSMLAAQFQRTASRLEEMRSEAYVQAPHKTLENTQKNT